MNFEQRLKLLEDDIEEGHQFLNSHHIQRLIDDARKMRDALDDLTKGIKTYDYEFGHTGGASPGHYLQPIIRTKKLLAELDKET